MQYRKFGRTGVQVSDIAPGLWGMSGWSGSNDRESQQALQLSVDLGCNFFDTAWAYGEGKSDGLLGQTIAKNKGKRLFAASKIPPKNERWPALPKYKYKDVFPPDHVFKYADLIRKQLGTDSIDLLQFHVWTDKWADDPDFRKTVEKLKKDGTIRYFGLSLNRWEPENGIKAIRTGLVDAAQVIYSIFDQSPEDKLFPLCKEMNIGVIVRVALDEGSLGGKMTKDTTFPKDDWRSGYFNPKNLANTMKRVDKLKEILPPGMSLPEMALRFVLSHPAVSTTIVGMRKLAHVRENIALSDKGPLSPELLKKLKKHRWNRKPASWSD
ncbi:MAG TPA: aldo/keto reductase [Terriglobales bacterium]|jgi:aryl-alcohol dehydrogenase-like predicted oxidoreductase|nr:aldo/keto reductase [Terriglobales bacterium]